MEQSKKLEIHNVGIDSLKPNAFNSNVVTAENRKKIENSLVRFGMFKPILCRQRGEALEIIGGQHRWEVAKGLGYQEVPVINLGELDDNRAKEISLADNARFGSDDSLKLSDLLNSLDDASIIASIMPYSEIEIETLMSASKIDFDSLMPLVDDDDFDDASGSDNETFTAKTHSIMRFKVSVEDAEAIEELLKKTMKAQGFSGSDVLTNAGDALTHLLLA